MMMPQMNMQVTPPSPMSATVEPATTIMIRNIPPSYNEQMLRQEIHDMGFADSYDFFFLPLDGNEHCGCAFINFSASHVAWAFQRIFTNYRFKQAPDAPAVQTATADMSSVDQLIASSLLSKKQDQEKSSAVGD